MRFLALGKRSALLALDCPSGGMLWDFGSLADLCSEVPVGEREQNATLKLRLFPPLAWERREILTAQ